MRKSNWSEGEVFIKTVKDLFSWQMRKLQLKARFKAAIVQCLEKKRCKQYLSRNKYLQGN